MILLSIFVFNLIFVKDLKSSSLKQEIKNIENRRPIDYCSEGERNRDIEGETMRYLKKRSNIIKVVGKMGSQAIT